MKQKYLFLFLIFVLISLASLTLSDNWILSSQGVDITNNQTPLGWVRYHPDNYHPIMDQTYIIDTNSNQIIVSGQEFDAPKPLYGSDSKGAFVEWEFPFSKKLPTGYYRFHTKANNIYGDEFVYDLYIIIDTISPTIGDIRLIENGLIDKSDTRIIERNSKAMIKARIQDYDGEVSSDFISDTKVADVQICLDAQGPCGKVSPIPDQNEIYYLNISDLAPGLHTAYFYAKDNLSNANSLNYTFSVNDTIKPIAPIIWQLPSETEDSPINVIGYTNERGLIVYVGSTGDIEEDPTYVNSKLVTYDSNLIGTFIVQGQRGDEIKVTKEAYDAIAIGNFVWFDTANLDYFRRYEVVEKKSTTWLEIYKIILSPELTQTIEGKTISVYDTPYPAGWFNISIELIPETQNYIFVRSVDDVGNKGNVQIEGPVYFHINPPVLYEVPGIVKESEIKVPGRAKPSSNVKIYRNSSLGELAEVTVSSNSSGEFSGLITLKPGKNYIYAKIVDLAGTPITQSSNKREVLYDNENPIFAGNRPVGTGLPRDNVEIVVYASDNIGLNLSSLSLKIDDNEVNAFYEPDGSRERISYTASFTTVNHIIKVSIKDLAGNLGEYSWSFTTYIPPQCVDEIDNDGDWLVDYMRDPGCDSQYDDNESNPGKGPTMPQCWDSIDNDNDGLIDYMQDLDCDDIWDDSEETIIVPICGDGIRNQMIEDCDKRDLRGLTCADFGCSSGSLGCDENCRFDINLCADCGTEYCRDGIKNRDEECDNLDLGISKCYHFDNYTGGILGCTSACEFDFTQCTGSTPKCGDGVINRIEELCDGEDLRGVTCQDLGFVSGELACNSMCDGYNLNRCYSEAYCNDGVKNRDEEECDSADLGSMTCESFGFVRGTLSCRENCIFDKTKCGIAPYCGDNVINQIIEDCDGSDLDGKTCQTFGYLEGNLACNACNFDTSGCANPQPKICGNNNVDKPNDGNMYEECDGTNFDGKLCTDFGGYNGGTLSCTSDCEFDFNECTFIRPPYCGDNVINQIIEDCDGSDLDGKTCQTFGYLEGNLACNACNFDTSGCANPQPKICGNNNVDKPNDGNMYEECDGTDLDGKFCTNFDYYDSGNLRCTSDCEFDFSECISRPPPVCMDNIVNLITEDCDGTDLRGLTCEDFGCGGGRLNCTDSCDFDISQCYDCGTEYCGYGSIGRDEECDGSDLGDKSCSNFDNYTGGILGCTSTCEFDFTQCNGPTPPRCGDNVINRIEELCDGEDLRGVTCQDLGFVSGKLACKPGCSGYIFTGCNSEPICRDGVKNRVEEQCDVFDLGSQTCESFGFAGGTLSCKSDCTLDRSLCVPIPIYACDDGKDNDNDRLIDYGFNIGFNDPGCDSLTDNDETDFVGPPYIIRFKLNGISVVKEYFNETVKNIAWEYKAKVAFDEIRIDGTNYNSGWVSADNITYSFNATLGSGSHNIAFIAHNLVAQTTQEISFIVDTVPPTVTIDSSSLVGTQYLNIKGRCGDNFYLSGIEVLLDGEIAALPNEVKCISGQYEVEISLGDSDEREHEVTAIAIDGAGNSRSVTKIIDTGVPEIIITDVVVDGLIFGERPYKTNSDEVTIHGTYMDENLQDITFVVFLNNNPISSVLSKSAIGPSNGIFEVKVKLEGLMGEEFVNNISIIVTDKSGLDDRAEVIVVKDLRGPQIIQFEPKTYTTASLWPTISITTNEGAEGCWIKYTAKATMQVVTEQFDKVDNTHFSVTLDRMIDYNDDKTNKLQNIEISCKDLFSNSASHTIEFVVDLNKPIMESYSVYYGIPSGILLLSKSDNEKEYVVIIFDMQGGAVTNVLLSATTNENTRCSYSGSSSGQFKNYDSYTVTHQTDEILIYDKQDYYYRITCEDKAGTKTDVKTIRIGANSDFDAGEPIVRPIYPPKGEIPVVGSLLVRFNGSITPPAGYSITKSTLSINGQTYDLGVGEYSVGVQFSLDGDYPYTITVLSDNGRSRVISGSITIDTTPPKKPGVTIE